MSEPYAAYEEDAIARVSTNSTTDPQDREPRSYLPLLVIANIGILTASLTPIVVSMAFKLQHITSSPAAATNAQGLVLGVGAIFALVANPLAGRLSDRTFSRFGMRRPWLIGGGVLLTVGLMIVGFAPSVPVVLVGWCISQTATSAVQAALNATIPDQSPGHRRGRISGIVGIGISIAILGGTGLTSVLTADWARFTVPALVGLVAVTAFAIVLKDKRLPARPTEPFRIRQFAGSFVINPRKAPDFGWVWLTRFCVGFAYVGVASFLPLYLTDRFGLKEEAAIGIIVVANVASTLGGFVSGPLGGWLSDRVQKRRPFVLIGALVMLVGLVMLAFAHDTTVVVVAEGLVGLGGGCFFAVDIALATQVLPDPKTTAKDLGVMSMANALPQSLAPVLAPPIIAIGGLTAIGGFAVFYLFSGVIALGGAVSVYKVKKVK